MKQVYEKSELIKEMEGLKNTFDVVRLVDPLSRHEFFLDEDTDIIRYCEYECHAVWNKEDPCKNCISQKAIMNGKRYTKFEFIDSDIYNVVAKYITVDGMDAVLEVVTKLDADSLFEARGANEFVERIEYLNVGVYKDELSGAYNRRYLNEKLPILMERSRFKKKKIGLAIIDIDYLKTVNDSFGHQIGDEIIKIVSKLLEANVSERRGDFVTRYGGDEFIVVFNCISRKSFVNRLELLVEKVKNLKLDSNPETYINSEIGESGMVEVSFSVGGAMSDEKGVTDMNSIIAVADKRLYEVKRSGRNAVKISSDPGNDNSNVNASKANSKGASKVKTTDDAKKQKSRVGRTRTRETKQDNKDNQ